MNSRKKEPASYDFMVKLLILGDSATGKSAIMDRFCESVFSTNHIATIGVDFKYKTVDCEGKRIKLQIWDTAGQEKFRSIVQTYYKGAMGIVLTYAINDRKSFKNVEMWMKEIQTNAAKGVVVLLVGNKIDLTTRVIEEAEGKQMAQKYGVKFFETSAKDGTNIDDLFYEIAREIKIRVANDPSLLAQAAEANDPRNGSVRLKKPGEENDNQPSGKKCKC